ncbi:HEAT repeat protein [Carpediemonas membranifera]|uniref:HEAT repeat protein n=1 Tax=Carpediemonas membranifera TaxID=201153 RepID=A0A8J6E2X1_9EUKA|nr:HEAT repeat protein [Carpediemonas membranifera]|eukprot:KAG9394856.1 HEAT repeat protein [Carpediemonas membranifera]
MLLQQLRRNSTLISSPTRSSTPTVASDTTTKSPVAVEVHSDGENDDVNEENKMREAVKAAVDGLREKDKRANPFTKLVTTLDGATKASTLVALSTLQASDFTQSRNQALFLHADGLKRLVRMIGSSDDVKARVEALTLMAALAQTPEMRTSIVDCDGMAVVVDLLGDERTPIPVIDKALTVAAEAAVQHSLRRSVRQKNGLPLVLGFLKPKSKRHATLPLEASRAMAALLESKANRSAVIGLGGVATITGLANGAMHDLTDERKQVVAHCMRCLRQFIVTHPDALSSTAVSDTVLSVLSQVDYPPALEHAAALMADLSKHTEVQGIVHRSKGVSSLCRLVDRPGPLTSQALTALTHLAEYPPNRKAMIQNKLPPTLASLLKHHDEVLVGNAALLISALAQNEEGRNAIKRSGSLSMLVGHLKAINPKLLSDVSTALATMGRDPKAADEIVKADGIRLLWSLLKMEDPAVVAAAASALVPLLEPVARSAMVGRTFHGGAFIVASLFKSTNEAVLGYACALVSQLVKDPENCQIMTELGVIDDLCRLVRITKSDLIRQHAANALGYMADSGSNREYIGQQDVLQPLVRFLTDTADEAVHRATAHALSSLASNADNAMVLRDVGAHIPLVKLMACDDEVAQEMAAGAVRHLRVHYVSRMGH